jgi:hypothetical protein
VAGVLHAAGVLVNAPIKDQTASAFEQVCDAKVTGGWNLHRSCVGMSTDR